MLSSLANNSPIPFWIRDENLNIIFCNVVYSEIVAPEQESALTAEQMELAPEVKTLAKSAKDEQKVKSSEIHVIAGGERKLFLVTEIPSSTEGRMYGYAVDISSEESAREKVKLYVSAQSDFLESSNNAMCIYGPDSKLNDYNQSFVKLWHLDERWLDSAPNYGEVLEMLRENRRLPEQINFQQFKKTQLKLFTDLIHTHEEFYYLPDGTALRVIVIPHALGGLLFAYEDVTDRLALERSYNTLIAVQKATLDNLHEGVAVFGEDGRIKLYNPVYAKLWFFSDDFLVKQPHISELVEKSKDLYIYENQTWEEYKSSVVTNVTSHSHKYGRRERSDGKVLDWSAVPMPDGAVLMTYLDVSDSTLLEQTLRDQNKALEEIDRIKTEFLANVSYELRSPLTTVIGFADMLRSNFHGELNQKQREYIDGIYKSSSELKDIIDDILDISSIEAGYLKLMASTFDIRKAVRAAVSIVKDRIKENQIKFRIVCQENIGKIHADETRIKQMLIHLLSNAIKFTPQGGSVTIGAEDIADKNEVRFWVEDNGVGIAEEQQKIVFDKFYKTTANRSKSSGAGLGLTLVKNFVELHGGRIELHSRENEGTLVSVFLPRNSYSG